MTVEYEGIIVPGPTITPISEPFWNAVKRKVFILQRCSDCMKFVFYPRSLCPHCWIGNLVWEKVSGRGILKTWSIVHTPGHPGWKIATPYVVGLVELEEGPTMLSHLLIDNRQELEMGLPLQVHYQKCGEHWLPFFKKVE
nr:OB-fold domain-containing protein [Fredinandcohnia onubensis]